MKGSPGPPRGMGADGGGAQTSSPSALSLALTHLI